MSRVHGKLWEILQFKALKTISHDNNQLVNHLLHSDEVLYANIEYGRSNSCSGP